MTKANLPGFFSRYSKRSRVAVSNTDPGATAAYLASNQSIVAPLVAGGTADVAAAAV